MFDHIVAAASSHITYCKDGWPLVREALASGCSFAKLERELPHGKLRTLLSTKRDVWDQAKKTVEWCEANGAEILYPGHAWYPEPFSELQQPPQFLTMKGVPAWQGRTPGLSIVGGREPTSSAKLWLEEHLPPVLRSQRLLTISGGARGIDQTAHRLSLREDLPTVAFLPSGLARVYPLDFSSWISDIVESKGAVISEYPPDVQMFKSHFHRRNRMIAALGRQLFVVEASRNSGSLITARFAVDLSRPICVLPSAAIEARALGTLDLLFDGAYPIRDATDLLEFVKAY